MSYNHFEQECLQAHNQLRAKHGCPPLALDRGMCNYANEWAQNLARSNCLNHRSNNRYGENLFMAGGREISATDAVQAWYDEISQYNYNSPGFGGNTGHFTQVVWRSSQKLGVGVAKNGSSTYVVTNYDPPGNFAGQYPNNVPTPQY